MRRIYNIIIGMLSVAAVACTTDAVTDGTPQGGAADDKGALRLNVSVAESDAPFALRIFSCANDGTRSLVRKYTAQSDIPEYVWLVAGEYYATAELGEPVAAAFDGGYYYGEQAFTVTAGVEPSTVDLVCYAENIPVEVAYDATVSEGVENVGRFDSFNTTVVAAESCDASEAPTLNYDASRTGYFMLPEGCTTIAWRFVGKYKYEDGEIVDVRREGVIENVAKRTHYKLSFKYSADANGSLSIAASVDTSVDHRNDHIAFNPDPEIRGVGFDVATPCNYTGGSRTYTVTALDNLTTLTFTVDGQTYDPINGSVDGVVVTGVNTPSMQVTLSAAFFNAMMSGQCKIYMRAGDASGGEANATLIYNLQGVNAYSNVNEKLAWTGGTTTLSATVFNAPSAVEMLYRTADGEWQHAAASAAGSNTYTAQISGLSANATYEYRLVINGEAIGASRSFTMRNGAQIPNGDMEGWSKSGDVIVPDPSSTSPYWCSGNYGTASFGGNITYESTDVRPGSKGKKSAYMGSKYIVVKFAAGNMYVGSWGGMNGMNAIVYFGQPFTFDAKPKAIRFWAKYNCGIIDRVDKGVGKKGDPDLLKIFCCLTTASHVVDSSDGNGTTFSPSDANIKSGDARYNIVLYSAYMESTESQNDWKMYEIPFTFYGDDPNQVPTHLILTYTCSGYGDFFDGSTSSWMYVDDIELVY